MTLARDFDAFYVNADQVIDVYLHEDLGQSGSSPYTDATTVVLKITDFTGTTSYTCSATSASEGHYRATLDSSYHTNAGPLTAVCLVDGVPFGNPKRAVFEENP